MNILSGVIFIIGIASLIFFIAGGLAFLDSNRSRKRWIYIAEFIKSDGTFKEVAEEILNYLSTELKSFVWVIYRYDRRNQSYHITGLKGSYEKEITPKKKSSEEEQSKYFSMLGEEDIVAPTFLVHSERLEECGIQRDRGYPLLNLPLKTDGKIVGLIQIFPIATTKRVLAFINNWSAIGEYFSKTLYCLELQGDWASQMEDMEASNRLGETILGSIFNANDFMSKILEIILMNTQSTAVRLSIKQNGLIEEGKEEVNYISATQEPLNEDASLWRSIETALQTTSHLSLDSHPLLLKPINAQFLTGVNVNIKEGKAGVLTLYRESGESYDDREIMIARVFAEKIELFTQTATAYRSASEAYRSTVQLLVEMMDAREAQTLGHSNRVMFWALSVGKVLGLDKEDMETLKWASLFHDVGMCGIEESVQNTKGRLGDDQMARIRQHPKLGAVICDPLHLPHPISPAIITHHERWDGRGYPNALKGEKIPILGRIVALAEIFNAFVSPRNYRSALPLEEAVKRVRDESGAALDPTLVDAFLLALKSDPVFNILKRGR